jgi:hypothetical protein
MTNVTVNIVGGTQKENTEAVTIANVRWGLNGTANFGKGQNVPEGDQDLTVYKTTPPNQISIKVQVSGDAQVVNIQVNDKEIIVN